MYMHLGLTESIDNPYIFLFLHKEHITKYNLVLIMDRNGEPLFFFHVHTHCSAAYLIQMPLLCCILWPDSSPCNTKK